MVILDVCIHICLLASCSLDGWHLIVIVVFLLTSGRESAVMLDDWVHICLLIVR